MMIVADAVLATGSALAVITAVGVPSNNQQMQHEHILEYQL